MGRCESVREICDCEEAQELFSQLQDAKRFEGASLNDVLANRELFRLAANALVEGCPTLNEQESIRRRIEEIREMVILSSQEPANKEVVAAEVRKQEKALARLFKEREGVELAGNFSTLDLITAAVNAYCTEDNYALPSFDSEAMMSDTLMTVTPQNNLQLFLYLSNASGEYSPYDGIPRSFAQGEILCNLTTYESYIEALQEVSRLIDKDPGGYLDDLVDLTSGSNYSQQAGQGTSFPSSTSSMLYFSGLEKGRATFGSFLTSDSSKRRIQFGLSKEQQVYIPGAGLDTLRDFLPMIHANSKLHFVLNDKNPFVAGVLGRLADLHAASNIQVREGGFEEVELREGSIGIMVLSSIRETGVDNITVLAEKAASFIKDDGIVLVFNPDSQSMKEGKIDSGKLMRIFRANGFVVEKRSKSLEYELSKLNLDDPKESLSMPASDLSLIINSQSFSKTVFGSFIVLRKSRTGEDKTF